MAHSPCDRSQGRVAQSGDLLVITAEFFAKPKPSDRHWYAYDVLLEGETVISNSRDLENDLARALLARGIKGTVSVINGVLARRAQEFSSGEQSRRDRQQLGPLSLETIRDRQGQPARGRNCASRYSAKGSGLMTRIVSTVSAT